MAFFMRSESLGHSPGLKVSVTLDRYPRTGRIKTSHPEATAETSNVFFSKGSKRYGLLSAPELGLDDNGYHNGKSFALDIRSHSISSNSYKSEDVYIKRENFRFSNISTFLTCRR